MNFWRSLASRQLLECGGRTPKGWRHRFRTVYHFLILLTRLQTAALAILAAVPALAHDRHGNAAMHQDVRVLIAKDHVAVTFQIETNEEGTFVEAIAMDANGDGRLATEEQSAYFAQLDARLREGLQISVNHVDVLLAASAQAELSPPSRKTFRFRGDLPDRTFYPATLEVHNDNFLDWPGRTTLEVEPGEKCVLSITQKSASDVMGAILPHDIDTVTFPARPGIDWSRYSRARLLTAQTSMAAVAATLLTIACLVMLTGHATAVRRVVGLGLITASFVAAGFAIASWRERLPSSDEWHTEFRVFHGNLCAALATWHREGDATSLHSLCSRETATKLCQGTRVADSRNEKSGAFELRRVRPTNTTILETPRGQLDRILRVHHEWRAIGLMRHHGHPHERSRDFSCDYTLLVTEHGLRLIDCSEWHQLPDEPIEQ